MARVVAVVPLDWAEAMAGAEGDEHGGVNGTGIIEKGANNLFDMGEIGRRQVSRCVRRRGESGSSAIGGCSPGMQRMLGLGWSWVLETSESFLDITGHGAVNGVSLIIPAESHSQVEGAGTIFDDGVVHTWCRECQQDVRCVHS